MQVWKATHLETQQVVALKIVFWGNPSVKEAHRKILMKEVEALTLLKHENIVTMTEHVDDDKNLAMSLEFLNGGGLLERLNQVEHYSEAQAAALFRQMLAGVAYMHSQNFIHRDIKPENMVFTESLKQAKAKKLETSLKLVDFGLARLHHPSRSVKSRLGSPGFMSPEVCSCCIYNGVLDVGILLCCAATVYFPSASQVIIVLQVQTIEFERHTPAMDVFALGVILFIMLTGHKPMKTEQASNLSYSTFEAHEYPRMTSHSWTRLSKPAKDLVLRMLEKNPTKRITASEVPISIGACNCLVYRKNMHEDDHALSEAALDLHYAAEYLDCVTDLSGYCQDKQAHKIYQYNATKSLRGTPSDEQQIDMQVV